MPTSPPPLSRLALEQLAVFEYGSLLATSPLLSVIPKGDGHPVLFLPGFLGSDSSTAQLRFVLAQFGHAPHRWHLGTNLGPHPGLLAQVSRRVAELHDRFGRKVSLVGWSLGGIYAREEARDHPDMVRQVITLASPFRWRPGDRTRVSALYDHLGPETDPFPGHATAEHDRPAMPVPSTSIYTRSDGIVRWCHCLEEAGDSRENIEVFGTHIGLGSNIAAVVAIADRLAQADGQQWASFRPPAVIRHLYRAPAVWVASTSRRTP